MNKISFIIPCYNAEKFINKKILKLIKKLNTLIKYEIIFIDDGSIDNTFHLLQNLQINYPKKIIIIKNNKNQGKSYSIIRGIKKAKNKKIILYDCDTPYFKYLKKVILSLDDFSFVYINRKSEKSKLINKKKNIYQIFRYIVGRLVCSLINIFILRNKNIGDTQSGLKGFDRINNFNKIKFISKKFFFDVELFKIVLKEKRKILSIPVSYSIHKESTIKIFKISNVNYILELLKIFFKHSLKIN